MRDMSYIYTSDYEETSKALGMNYRQMKGHFDGLLCGCRDLNTGKVMLCWDMSETQAAIMAARLRRGAEGQKALGKGEQSFKEMLTNGPHGFLEVFVFILLLPLFPILFVLSLIRNMVKFVDDTVTREVRCEVEYGGGCGGGLFDEVSSARKADVEFLFGGFRPS